MKKIINYKMYNTETATMVASYTNGYGFSDFHYIGEELYRKKTGEYFLYGRGGAMTMYGECCGSNSWSGGSAIFPLTVDEAQEWVMEHCDADTYISLFGEVEE